MVYPVRFTAAQYERLKRASDKKTPLAPTIAQIIRHGVELALAKMEKDAAK